MRQFFPSNCQQITHNQFSNLLKNLFKSQNSINKTLEPSSIICNIFESRIKEVQMDEDSLQTFKSMLNRQLQLRCLQYDKTRRGSLDKNQTQLFLYNVLELENRTIEFIVTTYFPFHKNPTITYSQFIQIVSQVHFRQIFSTLIRHELNTSIPPATFLNKTYFSTKLIENCFFFTQKPSKKLAEDMFDQLMLISQSGRQHQISLQDFRAYILRACCSGKVRGTRKTVMDVPNSIAEVQSSRYEDDYSDNTSLRPKDPQSNQKIRTRSKGNESNRESKELFSQKTIPAQKAIDLKDLLWKKIQKMLSGYSFKRYGFLTDQELQHMLAGEGLLQSHQKLLNMVKKNKQITIQFLIGYLIHFHGEQALRVFSSKQIKGKAKLNKQELIQILKHSYFPFIGDFQHHLIEFVEQFFAKKSESTITYQQYMQIVSRNLSKKAQK